MRIYVQKLDAFALAKLIDQQQSCQYNFSMIKMTPRHHDSPDEFKFIYIFSCLSTYLEDEDSVILDFFVDEYQKRNRGETSILLKYATQPILGLLATISTELPFTGNLSESQADLLDELGRLFICYEETSPLLPNLGTAKEDIFCKDDMDQIDGLIDKLSACQAPRL